MRLTSTLVVVSILCCAISSTLAKASAISVAAPDRLPNNGGNEHQESREISLPADYFLSPDKYTSMAASLFPHEYIHAWNGISHRPASMVTPDFGTPMQDAMLWVYE